MNTRRNTSYGLLNYNSTCKTKLLVLKISDIIIYTDVSIENIRGVIYYACNFHAPLVFKITFPDSISQSIKNIMKVLKENLILDVEALALVVELLSVIL